MAQQIEHWQAKRLLALLFLGGIDLQRPDSSLADRLYITYRAIRWWCDKKPGLDGWAYAPTPTLVKWTTFTGSTIANHVSYLEKIGLIEVKHSNGLRLYKLGRIDKVRHDVAAHLIQSGHGLSTYDVLRQVKLLPPGPESDK